GPHFDGAGEHFGDAGDPCGLRARRLRAGNEQVDRAQSGRGGDDAGGGGGEGAIVDLGQDQNAHHRASISSTSARMMAASSDADPTMLPAGRSGGGAMASMARRGARS